MDLEKSLLSAVDGAPGGVVEDSGALATTLGCDHKALVGCIKSLLAAEMILTEVWGLSRLGTRRAAAADGV